MDEIALWPDAAAIAPLATMMRYPGPSATAPVVLVLPGGGYMKHADHEGHDVALWLNEAGFRAAVLRYRCGRDHPHPAPIEDAARAARLLRRGGAGWGPAPRLGVLGFSAGGHLAATLASWPDRWPDPRDELAGAVSARVEAAVLGYPVIHLSGQAAHRGSGKNLCGPGGDEALREALNPARAVNGESPPTFLWHTADDPAVPVANALDYALACHRAGVAVELHVYESGAHGLGLAPDHPAGAWCEAAGAFLDRHLGGAGGTGR